MVFVGSLLTTVALYELVVRRTNATRFLFGMKPLARVPREHRAHVPAVR